MNNNLIQYIYGIADNALILGQRLGELCGHGPSLETDIAMTNISLDLLGQVRSYYQYAAKLQGENVTEDRQFLFDVYHLLLLENLQNSRDETLQAIAKKSIKEVSYHTRFSSDWIKRLGDGTDESHERVQNAINDLWTYTDELFHLTDEDKMMISEGIGVDVAQLKASYYKKVNEILQEATIQTPDLQYFQKGGKQGIHSEYMGYILAEMQYMQRAYPNMNW